METARTTIHVLAPVGALLGDVGQMDFSRNPGIFWTKLHLDFETPRVYLLGFLEYEEAVVGGYSTTHQVVGQPK